MEVRDRVLDGEDVTGPPRTHVADDGSQGRRLAGARRSGHEDQALRRVRELLDDRWQAQITERGNGAEDQPEGQTHGSPLVERVGTEARVSTPAEREVDLALGLEALDQPGRQHTGDE